MSNDLPTIGIGTDHAGFEYKEFLRETLKAMGYTVEDFGTYSRESVDYPVFIKPTARAVAEGSCDLGIVLGGSGNGEAMSANKVTGIRCALCWDANTGRLARQHNDANMISLGQRQISRETALDTVLAWLNAEFEGGRHQHRIDLIETA